jgi:hypothetical protein
LAVRRQRSTTKEAIVVDSVKECVRKGKLQARNHTNEFYVYETHTNSGYYFPNSVKLTDNYIEFWKFNLLTGLWECLHRQY